ncbi:MAG TPA: NAD(P)H-hydrate dehydratase [Ktedonobacterales bacterium]|jgi:NAD(P)H-hydrate epimerase
MKIVSIDQMRELEARAERELGMSSRVLMENAGRSAADLFRGWAGDIQGKNAALLIGPGNNGGDGLVIARHLKSWGARLTLYLWKEGQIVLGGEGGFAIPVRDDLKHLRVALASADFVFDAILGTGRSRPLDPTMRAALAIVREAREKRRDLRVVAVDLPTGVNADTGQADEGAIPADVTITLANPKLGLFFFPGAALVGELLVGSIGLPADMDETIRLEMLTDALARQELPARPLESNKGTFGKVMVLAGSPPYPGSAYLAATAAGRIGAGLITLAVEPEMLPIYSAKHSEATFALLPGAQAAPEERAKALLGALEGYGALVMGPGLGRSEATRSLLFRVLEGLRAMPDAERPRLVLDADGLNNLASLEHWWELLPKESILTPHPGEMSRLCGGQQVSGGGPDRLEIAQVRAREWGQVVVLKGACTIIAAPDGRARINWRGNPALATAGTGDVLAGAIGGLLAQGMAPFEAASAGVFLHSRAGSIASETTGDAGLLASDLLPLLPVARKQIQAMG